MSRLYTVSRPPFLSRARVLTKPSFVRSTIRSHSNWLKAWKTVINTIPCRIGVSKIFLILISFTFLVAKKLTKSIQSFLLLSSLEKISITTIFPALNLSFNRFNSSLFDFVLVAISVYLYFSNKSSYLINSCCYVLTLA